MILSCYEIKKSFGDKEVLRDITFHINEHEKVAMIGNNGAGKTTLFHIIQKELEPDDGVISIKKDATVGYLAQVQNYKDDRTIMEELLDAKRDVIEMEERIRQMEEEMKSLNGEELEQLMNRYHEALHLFDLAGGYTYKSDIQGILRGLNFPESDFGKSVLKLSGGERTRLSLGRILLTAPDLILLDEPTNYLDIASVTWLENYLLNYKKSVFIVSHDRYFLDRIVNKVIEIEAGHATTYDGNYSAYSIKKEMLRNAAMNAYIKQQAQIEHQEAVIEKLRSFNREKSIKRAESRVKALEKIERLDKPVELNDDMQLTLIPRIESGKDVLAVNGLSKSYGSNSLFENLAFELKRGDHVAIIGDNGTGKTTLLKIINGVESPDFGSYKLGTKVTVGYYDQEHHVLNDDNTIFNEISDAYPSLNNTEIRNVLAAFLFTGEDVFKKIGSLSGGEKGRVSLQTIWILHPKRYSKVH